MALHGYQLMDVGGGDDGMGKLCVCATVGLVSSVCNTGQQRLYKQANPKMGRI
jgi:hypothetical protein